LLLNRLAHLDLLGVTGFLVQFGAQAAEVLGGSGGGVRGAGEAFAGALFVVEAGGRGGEVRCGGGLEEMVAGGRG